MEGIRTEKRTKRGGVAKTMLTVLSVLPVLTLLSAMVVTAGAARGEYLVVHPTAGGQLKDLIGDKLMTIDSLVVDGPMDHTDFATIHPASATGKLAVVNLSHADIDGDSVPSGAFAADTKIEYDSKGPCRIGYCETVIRRVILPNNLKKIGNRAFHMAQLLWSVNLPDSLEEIGAEAFAMLETHEIEWPNALRTIGPALPSKLRKIGSGAFKSCRNIEEIEIPEGMTELGDSAFWACRGIKTLRFPSTLESIGEQCFARLVNLKRIICKATVAPTCPVPVRTQNTRPYYRYYPIWEPGDFIIDFIDPDYVNDRTCRDVMIYIPRGSSSDYKDTYNQWAYFYWSNFVEVDDFDTLSLGVEDVHANAAFNVDCSSGQITVSGLASSGSYQIYDMAGALRRSGTLHSGDNTIGITPGMYILRIGATARNILVP